ncbi:MAG: PrsW family intramembrane metalloprotease, partial [Bacteroidales bacterium]|nr:PrsW family intramembrane metalloprotease [Bacteroidales bacterium]
TFFAGMLAIPLDLLIIGIFGLDELPYLFDGDILQQIGTAFFSAAIPEEISKFIILFLLVWWSKDFNERMDGIVYAVCVSMGFATVENVMYVFEDPSCAWGRALFAVPGHFLFAVLMGFFLSLAKFTVKHKFRNWTMTLLAPILAHGIYDAILMVSDVASEGWSLLLTIVFYVFIFLLWRLGLKKISQHVESSPFRYWREFKDKQQDVNDISDDQQIDNMKDFFDR